LASLAMSQTGRREGGGRSPDEVEDLERERESSSKASAEEGEGGMERREGVGWSLECCGCQQGIEPG